MACQPIRLIPGPPGQDGSDGTGGADGAGAVTVLTAEFTMPAEGATENVMVEDSSMLSFGEKVYVRFAGTMEVNVIVGPTEILLKNISVSADGIYPDTAAPGSIIPIGAEVVPTGLQGPEGVAGTNGTNGTNGGQAFSTLSVQFTMPAEGGNFFTDVVSTSGFAVGQITFLEGAGYLQVVSITNATQLTLKNVENTAGSQYVSNVAPGTIVAVGAKLVSAGIQGPKGATGTTGADGDPGATGAAGPATGIPYACYQDSQVSGTVGYTGTVGAWTNIRLTQEMFDPSGIGVLAANSVSLAAGVYRAKWRVPGVGLGTFMTRLYNATDITPVLHDGSGLVAYGSNARSLAADYCDESVGECRFTLLAVKLILPQIRISIAGNLGAPASFGTNEIYSSFEIWKES